MPYTIEDLLDRERRRWMKPNAHLYMRPDAHRFTRSDAYTCGYSSKAIGGYQEACRKAGFDPDQPRVPAGRPDAGQWISGGGTTGWEANPNRNRLDDRFHESCHKRGIHLSFRAPMYAPGALR